MSGHAAPKGRYKWIASLRLKGSDFHFCTGSLIAPRVVTTAAHVRNPGGLSLSAPLAPRQRHANHHACSSAGPPRVHCRSLAEVA